MNWKTMESDACGIGAVVSVDGIQSRKNVDQALQIVEKLEHRAGKDAKGTVGDGVGILVQIPHRFFKKELARQNIEVKNARDYAVGMFFMPTNRLECAQAQKLFEAIVKQENCRFLGWRKVPVKEEQLGQMAKECMPAIWQPVIERPEDIPAGLEFDKKLYVIRKTFEKSCPTTYACSLSSRTIVYKGMLLVSQLRTFYSDLEDEDFESAISIVHSRFSTNTTPSWQRAHPNRLIAHNGEINTIQGNCNRMLSREETMHSPFLEEYDKQILPVIDVRGSDSAMLDNTLEFLMMNDMPLSKAAMMLIPEPWKNASMDQEKKDFYHYYATMMEPWDGPAAVLFSDGDVCGAMLDRNGLRPARVLRTKDNTLILASEVGVLDLPEEQIARKSRLEPGKMLWVDTVKKEVMEDGDLKKAQSLQHPYGEWLHMNLLHLHDLPAKDHKTKRSTPLERKRLLHAFGYCYEDIMEQILPMALKKSEPLASMGIDIPLALHAKNHPSLFRYFKQRFAQVTNPPIDALREEVVTDTTVYLGSSGNLLEDRPSNCSVLEIHHPILTARDMDKIKNLQKPGFKTRTISLLFYRGMPLQHALDQMFLECDKAYHEGCSILVLSDKGVDAQHVAIPSLLAVSALEQYLIKTKKKTAMSIVLESAEPKTVHEFATLLGFGAAAIYPWLAHEVIEESIEKSLLDKEAALAIDDYNQAVLGGIVKIAAKMGISTLQSYQGAQIFEAIGINKEVIDSCFTNTWCSVEGIGFEEIEKDVLYRHAKAFDLLDRPMRLDLPSLGEHKLRNGKEAEDHLYDPKTIVLLQQSVWNDDYELFRTYTSRVDDSERKHTLRALLDFDFDKADPIPIEEVESAKSIVKRFKTGAMSYGSISKEAHECMAEAMNTLGGKSNSGEGGEDAERYGTKYNSAIKQVASGRFGVDSAYLCSAKEIQIKMAQGAKPGEGGHLPGSKVYPWVAKTRRSTPGVSLISPPPHHDIYSIEDLAQLIYDLKNANDSARISVKLCSEHGVGTIACGVAKAGAQVILISGFDGGTGAAHQSSIHSCGMPFELGILEAHQALSESGLRTRVALETDGKLMSGRDVAIAALLGAQEFGFATAPLVTMGCRMMRVCSQDTCPFGIATQNEELRKRFKGKPEYVMRFMLFIAEQVREIMAQLGIRTLEEMVGRTDLLKIRQEDSNQAKSMEALLKKSVPLQEQEKETFDFHLEKTLDYQKLIPGFEKALKQRKHKEMELKISSTDRSFGTAFGSRITRALKPGEELEDDLFVIKTKGGAGQSFGAFIPKGMTIENTGDANDYFGKGLSGGKLILKTPEESPFAANENVIAGNVAFYGATAGEAYINGKAGERFCVRNSGANVVVEGVGDHGLEYMTGGTVLVLGDTGKNFAAGMSGGCAYVLDSSHTLYKNLNESLVRLESVSEKSDIDTIRTMLKNHLAHTGSKKAQDLLERFDDVIADFKKIVPVDYAKMQSLIKHWQDHGYTREQAERKAFNQFHPKLERGAESTTH